MLGDLSFFGCFLCLFENSMLGQDFCYLSESHFVLFLILVCQYSIQSALNIWALIVMSFIEEYM